MRIHMIEKRDPEPISMSMSEFAKEAGRTKLVEHIANSTELYETMGLTPDSFQYFPEIKKLKLHFTPQHNQESHAGIIHGGVSAFMIDASAGALAMAIANKGQVAFTKDVHTTYANPVLTGVPMSITSIVSDEKIPESKRDVRITTEVHQKGVLLAHSEMLFAFTNEKVLRRFTRTNNQNNTQ